MKDEELRLALLKSNAAVYSDLHVPELDIIARTEAMFRHIREGDAKEQPRMLEMVLTNNGRASIESVLKRAEAMLRYLKTGNYSVQA